MQFIRYLLFPFAILYGGIVWIRNICFDWGIISSTTFNIPVICVGNLNVGGTGKSPMIAYLIQTLQDDYVLATLSRGYKRKTKGFKCVETNSLSTDVGDEPLQFKINFSKTIVAVDEKRVHGIQELQRLYSNLDCILLDDAFQHRYVTPSFSILLTAFSDLYCNDFMLPTGNLREPKIGAKRADVIVVTKCPNTMLDATKERVLQCLKLQKEQRVFFSKIVYSNTIKSSTQTRDLVSLKEVNFTVVTGIANPEPLLEYLKHIGLHFKHLKYPDHYNFSDNDLKDLKQEGLILTTEKDFMRLSTRLNHNQLFYLPITVQLDNEVQFLKHLKASL